MTFLERLIGTTRAPAWEHAVATMLDHADARTPLRAAHMLAQVLHETAGLRVVVENLNYSAEALLRVWPNRFTPELAQRLARNPVAIANHVYSNRLGNGPPESGDGWTYRGRGMIQITGRHNYRAYHLAGGEDVEADPDSAVLPQVAARIAAWYWTSRGINRLADDDDVVAVTRAVNGGTNGLADRKKWLAAAKRALAEALVPEPEPQPEPLGDFDVLVLHDWTPELLLRQFDAILAGERSVVLGSVVASVTGGRKLDVRAL